MSRYIARRLVQTIFVVLGVVTVVFMILRLSGDPIALLVPQDATQEQIEFIRKAYGFNEPAYIQYVRFLEQVAIGNFGTSIRFNRPALELVAERLPATLQLSLVALFMSIILSVPVGILAGVKRGSIFDNVCMIAALLGQSVPTFWLGVIFIIVFAVQLRWLPTSGQGGLNHLILPSFSLAAYSMARIARVARSSMLDVLGDDYIRTARAKGLSEANVICRHAVRNASISVVTVISYQFAALIGGAIITEVVFAWPGIGRLMVEAVYNRDYPVAQTVVFVIALFVAFINLVTDFVYVYLDPRIRFR